MLSKADQRNQQKVEDAIGEFCSKKELSQSFKKMVRLERLLRHSNALFSRRLTERGPSLCVLGSATTLTPSSEPSPTLSQRESRRRRCANDSRRTTQTFAASSSVSSSSGVDDQSVLLHQIASEMLTLMRVYCVADMLLLSEQPSRSRRALPTTRRCASRSCKRSWLSVALSAPAAWKRQTLSSAARKLSIWNCRANFPAREGHHQFLTSAATRCVFAIFRES